VTTNVISANTVDDLLRSVVEKVRACGRSISPSKGGAKELLGVLVELRDPRARMSVTETRGKIFSCLGELFWYLSASDQPEFIAHYISAYDHLAINGRIPGAYGPRLFSQRGVNQVDAVIDILRTKKDSRNAVIQLFDAEDLVSPLGEKPCTCTLQFFLRNGELHMLTSMRSNDVYLGLVHDVFCFTMIQEIIARSVGADLGPYRHIVGSLHLYDKDDLEVSAFLAEGWQESAPMPPMPSGDPWPSLKAVIQGEDSLRKSGLLPERALEDLDPYWADLLRLLAIFAIQKNGSGQDRLHELQASIAHDQYRRYLKSRFNVDPR